MPIKVPDNVPVAPARVLNLIKCTCSSKLCCTGQLCSCGRAGLPCTTFCLCSTKCRNPLNTLQNDVDTIDEDHDLDEI